LINQQPGYPLGRNFSKHQLVFDDGLHAPIADTCTCTKLLTNFNHSKPTIAFNTVTNHCDTLWGDACPWASLMTCVCMASLPPRNSLCKNFTCVFDSVDSLYCACNLRQISLGPTFSLVRNFITTRCAILIGTSLSLILNSSNWGEGRVWQWGEEGPHTPPHRRTRSLPNCAHSLVATDRGRFIFDLPTYLQMSLQ